MKDETESLRRAMTPQFHIGQRVRNIRTDELGTIVEGKADDPAYVPVKYDSDDQVWNTPMKKLEVIES